MSAFSDGVNRDRPFLPRVDQLDARLAAVLGSAVPDSTRYALLGGIFDHEVRQSQPGSFAESFAKMCADESWARFLDAMSEEVPV